MATLNNLMQSTYVLYPSSMNPYKSKPLNFLLRVTPHIGEVQLQDFVAMNTLILSNFIKSLQLALVNLE